MDDFNAYSINNPDWRNNDDLLNTFVKLESGFLAIQYDVLLAVECLSRTRAEGPTSLDIESFCCAIMGE